MAIGSRICGNFYVKTGGGDDEITSKRLNELDTAFNADKTKGSGQLIYDEQLGPLVFNLQDVVADLDQIRSYISPLPVDSGGTGTTSTTYCSLTANVTGTLPVGNGGTGATTLTSNAILIGDGTSVITANAKLTYDTNKLELGADADNAQTIKRVDHSDDDGGELHIKAGAGGGTDKAGGDLVLSPGSHTSQGDPGKIVFQAGEQSGSSGSTPQGLGDIGYIMGNAVQPGGSLDLKAGVFRGGNIGSTQMDASGNAYIPITATEWIQHFVEAKKGTVGGIQGYDNVSSNKVGYAAFFAEVPVVAFCEKVIPRGYAATAAIVYGSNAGGTGNESKFQANETSLISDTETSRVTSQIWGSNGTFSANTVGDGDKCITIGIILSDKNDIIYGGKIFITKV